MEKEGKSSILTNKQRGWLQDAETVAHENKVRGRIQERLRAAIATDSELLAEALEDGRISANTVGNGLDFAELGDGISALVAALYRVADENGLDGERTIRKGIERGEEGRIARLEQKLNKEGAKSLTWGEILDLRSEKPELAKRLNRAMEQDRSDMNIGMGTFDEEIEDFEED